MSVRTTTAAVLAALLVAVLSTTASAQQERETVDVSPPDERQAACQDAFEALGERAQLDLEPVAEDQVAELRFGLSVSEEDAARIDRLDETRQSLDVEKLRAGLEEELGDDFIALTWSYVDGLQVRVDSETVTAAVERLSLPNEMAVVPVQGALSEEDRRQTRAALRSPKALDTLGQLGVVAVETDERCGTITIVVEPGTDATEVRELLSDVPNMQHVVIRSATEDDYGEDGIGREDLQTVQSGGLRYRAGGGNCTSAAPWYANVWTPFGAPDPAWNQNVIECGTLINRDLQFSRSGSWFYGIREATANGCRGDSGGTIWRACWYSGVYKGQRGGTLPNVNGQVCRPNIEYSHVGYLPATFNLTAPVGFS